MSGGAYGELSQPLVKPNVNGPNRPGGIEHALIDDIAETAAQIVEAAGARNIKSYTVHDREPGQVFTR